MIRVVYAVGLERYASGIIEYNGSNKATANSPPGGGEDVDFCLRLSRWPLFPVPGAVVRHPWWRNGARDYSRFSGWARGDGRLVDLHPRFAYRRCPNLVEVLAAVLLGAAAWAAARGLPTVLVPVLTMVLALSTAELGVELYRCFLGADR